ncbi:MAG: RNA methyltransferase substrate-binding domain-containing protein, partial [Butyricicoccus pullicaecorum]|nr:RNA methyltransferase substrate-binding domain-containing protein [Butyricicoccus pullicaecorum]
MHNPKQRKSRPMQDANEENNLLEGRNAVIEFLRSGQDCDKVFVAQGARTGDIAALAKEHGVPVVTCDRRKLDGMSMTGNHQGVIAQVAAHAYASLD